MFNIPVRYMENVKVDLKDFVPKDIKSNEKKRIKDAIKKVTLTYQIAGEEIPSVINEEFRCQVIQFYDIEVVNIKDAQFIASIYQSFIKSFCVIHMYDAKDEVYSLAVKRLNQQDQTQIIIENNIVSEKLLMKVPDESKYRFYSYMNYVSIKNKQEKLSMYREWFIKCFMLKYSKSYIFSKELLNANFWYDSLKTINMFTIYSQLVGIRQNMKKLDTNAEKAICNKQIKKLINKLNIFWEE